MIGAVGEESVVVLRDEDRELRAFYNVCRHRAHQLLRGEGNCGNRVRCPYHAWTYSLKGELVAARNHNRVPNFKRADHSLAPVLVDELAGHVFVNLNSQARPMRELLPIVESTFEKFVPLDGMQHTCRVTFETEANWKVVADNFLECYHCDNAHAALVDGVNDMATYRVETGDLWSSHISGASTGTDVAYKYQAQDQFEDHGFVGFFLWPNTTLGIYPGAPNFVNHIFQPLGPTRTLQVFDFVFGHDVSEAEQRPLIDYVTGTLAEEDNALVESVQRGMGSRSYERGRLMVDPERSYLSEHALHHFHGLVSAASE